MKLAVWDIFRKVREGTERTTVGGLLSILAILVMLFLILFETIDFLSYEETITTIIDSNRYMKPTVAIHFDVTIARLPCSMVDIEVWDVLGTGRMIQPSSVASDHMLQGIKRNVTFGDDGQYDLGEMDSMGHVGHPLSKEVINKDLHDLSEDLTDDRSGNSLRMLQQAKYAVVDYYTPWCIWCERLLPHWAVLSQEIREEKELNVKMFKVNCEANPKLCEGVPGYPTIRFFENGKRQRPDYSGPRNVESLLDWIMGQINGGKGSGPGSFGTAASGDTPARFQIPDQLKKKYLEEENLPEGCRVYGSLVVSRIPGNFHIVAKGWKGLDINPSETNLSHKVNHFSFGDPMPDWIIQKLPDSHLTKVVNPFNGKKFVSSKPHQSFNHFLKVISAHYFDKKNILSSSRRQMGYLMTSSSKISLADNTSFVTPEIRISYDFSPTGTLINRKSSKTWYDYLTNLCALIGGVYTILNLLDVGIYNINQYRMKLKQLGGARTD